MQSELCEAVDSRMKEMIRNSTSFLGSQVKKNLDVKGEEISVRWPDEYS